MKIKLINAVFVFYLIGILSTCDHGIGPKESLQGFSGTIYFENWPEQSSLVDLRLIAFRNFPPGNIFNEITQGKAEVYPPLGSPDNLPFYADSTTYTMPLDTGVYEYIVVAQQFGPNITTDWFAVGQYDTTLYDTIPTAVEIFQSSILSDINIFVDFDSLPGQPF